MRSLILAAALFLCLSTIAQKTILPAKNYPSLLWEIKGKGMKKPSYLFGTMHVSNKMVFHLSDSFYLGIRNADVVALETDMGTWQEDFSRYDVSSGGYESFRMNYTSDPDAYITLGMLHIPSYDKKIELALYSSPAMVNNFLYRSNADRSNDFEEDTYLDMHIYQTGKKWGKKVCGVENFDRSMQLMKEAYRDALNEKEHRQRSYDEDFSYANMEDAYRSGNLDLLDTINKVNSTSAAFDEKFVYVRNSIQAHSIDSIIRTGSALFVGVGAAHLPGQRGVIELLRRMGYQLRPIKMTERDGRQKDEVEKIRVPVTFSRQTSADGFLSVNMPGKFYSFDLTRGLFDQSQFSDMSNGSYYVVNRINTDASILGHSEETVLHRIDSLIYENIPGKILSKQAIVKNGYKGFDITNRTRRGDYQRYNVFVTPFEVIIFKMSGNGEYVKDGPEADQFFNSIELKPLADKWARWSPATGGFSVELPHEPVVEHGDSWQYMAQEKESHTGFAIIRTDLDNYSFAEEDSFELNLMEESFASSDFIDKQVSRRQTTQDGHAALESKYRYKDGSVAQVRFIVQGSHYYTLIAHARSETPAMQQFLRSFSLAPFVYGPARKQSDTTLCYTVNSPVPLTREKKLSMMPELSQRFGTNAEYEESLNAFRTGVVKNDTTGESIYVIFHKPERYFNMDTAWQSKDSIHWKTPEENWTYRQRKIYTQPNGMKVYDLILGDPKSTHYVHHKVFTRDGLTFGIETEGDTLSQPSAFVTEFFNSFQPADTVKGNDMKQKKNAIFFSDFFGTDTTLHKQAIKNIYKIKFDSADFAGLKKGISSMSWKDKGYIENKKGFIMAMGVVKTKEASDYLGSVYRDAGDTVEIQYTALSALLKQKTAYSYQVFKDIMVTDPPVLDYSTTASPVRSGRYSLSNPYVIAVAPTGGDDDMSYDDNSFLDQLTDSLQLTTTIFRDILPLISIHDYEAPMKGLIGTLADSSMIGAKDYEAYQSKFLIEARQELKKQMIKEKNQSIKKAQSAQTDDKDDDSNTGEDAGQGNEQLSLYATLLMPFWDRTPAVPQLINQMLASGDRRLKFNTALLLLQYGKPLPDTLLRYFAGLDEYRYELYHELKERKKAALFPAGYDHQTDLAKSKLLFQTAAYQKPDSLVYLDRLPLQAKGRSGFVYFFKYRESKNDNTWKIATVGLVPSDPKQFDIDIKKDAEEDAGDYDFTGLTETKIKNGEPLKEQLLKELKKMQYAKRPSAARFYSNEGNEFMNLSQIQIKD